MAKRRTPHPQTPSTSDIPNLSEENLRYAEDLVARKARAMLGSAGITVSEIDDIAGDLRLDLIKRAGRYDARRSKWSTYSTRVVRNRCAVIVKSRSARMRDYRLCNVSLNDDAPDNDDRPPDVSDASDQEECVLPALDVRAEDRVRCDGETFRVQTVAEERLFGIVTHKVLKLVRIHGS